MENLKHYIRQHFGSQKACAKELNVSTQTVSNWVTKNPNAMLKHMGTIVKTKDTTATELMGEIFYHENLINGKAD